MRITKNDLFDQVDQINTYAALPHGRKLIVGCAYGGYRIEATGGDLGTGVMDLSPRGTAREVYLWLSGFAKALELGAAVRREV